MKTFTFRLALAALLIAQLTSCKTVQTYSFSNAAQRVKPYGANNTNTCSDKISRAQQRYIDYHNYVEALKKSYGIKTIVDSTSESSNTAAAPYMLLMEGK